MDANITIEMIDSRIKHNAALAAGIKRHLILRPDDSTLRRGLECFNAVIRELREIRNELKA
jgi:hypothetical protein